MSLHPSHETRFSWDASTYDEICTLCGATDQVPGGWGDLAYPCPNARPNEQERLANEAKARTTRKEDEL